MDWLKEHAYLAGWISPTVALIGMLLRGGGKTGETDWARMMLYIGFLTCLAAVFTPAIEVGARTFAGFVASTLGIYFMVQSSFDADVSRAIRKKKEIGTITPDV